MGTAETRRRAGERPREQPKEHLGQRPGESPKENVYWLHILKNFLKFGQDMHAPYRETLESITPATIEEFARTQLLPATRTTLTLTPTE